MITLVNLRGNQHSVLPPENELTKGLAEKNHSTPLQLFIHQWKSYCWCFLSFDYTVKVLAMPAAALILTRHITLLREAILYALSLGSAPSFSNSHRAPAVSNFISSTSSFTKGVSVYKTPANATLTMSAGTKPQSSDLGLAMKDESSD